MTDATVIIAAWKAEAHLARSVQSALAQRDVSLEVIVIDDASSDGTAALAYRMAAQDARISVLQLAQNGGPGVARNAGIDRARGDWIAVLDSDDAMAPERLASMIALARAKSADAIYDNFQPLDEAEQPVGSPHISGIEGPVRWDLTAFLAGNQAHPGRPSLGYLKPLLSRRFLNAQDVRYDPRLRNGEDFHLMLEMLARGAELWFTPKPGYLYTTRAGSISNRLDPGHARALARADAAFLDRHVATLPADCVTLMRRRQARIADLATTESAMQALRGARPDLATLELLRRPRAFGRFANQLGEAVRRRLR
ncbi:glycosyltransferase [Ruegeria sp. 2012CJ41-6]|uniref:Glycosyltransferase n=1 Tax=Ruegeria spongiae TaxID=2942209 RepID=A0ABT0Q8W8_9RHOB|nr:glycosyltransferase [Ruegeria spongiae]MCL6285628.1 glycosyltransferase [Ruegeria spongiae]